MRLYLSGPMTGITNLNFPAFQRAAAALRAAGYAVIDPSKYGSGGTWEGNLRRDLHALLDLDGVAVLPDWRHSRGACLEVHVALALGMPVLTVAEWINRARAAA